jgi:glycosyltransferase involved in cell wall biosynthesis
MKSLCLIITGLSTGGAETMLLKLLQNIDRTVFVPQVISLTDVGEIGTSIEALGIPVHALGMKPGRLSPHAFVQLVRLLRRQRPDVVHTWMYHADLIGGIAARLAGRSALAWCLRNSDLSREASKRSTRMVVRVCALLSGWLPRRILSCSERARAVHEQVGYRAGKIRTVPNGFDLSRFAPDRAARAAVRAELEIPTNSLVVGLMARADPQKNHAGFIDAAARVAHELPDTHFVLAGTGIDDRNGALVQLIEGHRLRAQFHLLGRREDMPQLMAALDVLASTSSFGEAFPNVLGEAMACGVPCVVTDVGDSAEIVGACGRVVNAGDMGSLAREMVTLLKLPAESRAALGHHARERVRERYEIGAVARRYEDFYLSLLREA